MDMSANDIMAANEIMAPNVNANCQYSTRYCWEAEKVKSLIRLRAELSPLFTGKRNASKYAWAVVERELNVPLPLSKIIKKWNNLLQEYKAIKMSEEPKRREWPFFTLMDVYFSDQVNDPSLRLFSSTKTLRETIDDSVFEDDPIIASAIAAATSGAYMDIDELIRRQKERAADRKFGVSDYKYDMKPMMTNNKYNSNDVGKLSKSVDDLTMQQYKIKDEILRQHEQQENIVKIKQQHARQQQQQQQQQRYAQHSPPGQQQTQQQQHQQQQQQPQQVSSSPQSTLSHRLQQPTPPPNSLHAIQQQQQQHHLMHQQQQQQQQQQRQQQQHSAAMQMHQQQQQQQSQKSHSQQSVSPVVPTTAQQIHIQTAQHQAAQQQLHLAQQQQHQQQHQHQPQAHQQHSHHNSQSFSDPNTIDQYLLSWNNFHGNMCRGFHTLQKDEKMVDVTIAAGGKIFKAHKLVLSVCSPYFQQIFLENPSSHPILLMADVEAGHMAGLLDFMYSGQVNVKYEDLPVFLKVAEAMKIKGLHTEKNMDDDSKEVSSPRELDARDLEWRFDRGTHSVNITGQPFAHALAAPQITSHDVSVNSTSNVPNNVSNDNNNNNNNTKNKNYNNSNNNNNNINNNTPLSVQSFSNFRDHIKSKATLAENFMKNLSNRNNNNNNNNDNNNNNTNNNNNNLNHLGNTCPVGSTTTNLPSPMPESPKSTENFSILQTNSKKMLESTRKQHKYLAKRKILMHYNDELNEKRRKELEMEREMGYIGMQHDANNNNQETMEPITTTTNSTKIDAESTTPLATTISTTNTTIPSASVTPTPPVAAPPAATGTACSNNFKIRLLENHLNNSKKNGPSNGNNDNDNIHDHHHHDMDVDDDDDVEEEALNLAQNTQNRQEKIIPNMELVKIEPMTTCDLPDKNNNNNNNKNNNNIDNYNNDGDDDLNNNDIVNICGKKHHDNDNNNNNIESMATTDNNNNNNIDLKKPNLNLKHTASALLNAINRNIGLMDNNNDAYITRNDDLNEESDNNNNKKQQNNNNNKKSDDQTNDANNNNQLDLSNAHTVKNIATAEILCGLKSKVFKIEQDREREREREVCRNRSEIHNAE